MGGQQLVVCSPCAEAGSRFLWPCVWKASICLQLLTVDVRVADGATGAARLTPQQLLLVSGQQPYNPGSTADTVEGKQG